MLKATHKKRCLAMLILEVYLVSCLTTSDTSQAQALSQAQVIMQLMQAAQQGEVAIVRSLVKQLPPDSRDELARTAVHYAVEHIQPDVLDALLYGGANPNIIDAQGKTPYDLWEKHKDKDIERILKREKAKSSSTIQQELLEQDREIYTKKNSAALFQAAADGARDTVEQLLEIGTDPKTKNSEGLFPFHVAEQNNHPAVAGLLLIAMLGINGRDNKSWTPMHWAVLAKDWDMVRSLLRKEAHFRYRVPLQDRTYQDPYDVAKRINAEERFVSLIFAEQRDDIVKTLAEKAVREEKPALIKHLAQHGLNLKENKEVASALIQQAVRSNKHTMIRFLFKHGIHEDSTNGLLADRHYNRADTLELLLEYIKDRDELIGGYIASYRMTSALRLNFSEIFIQHGVDPANVQNSKGETPIHIVVKKSGASGWGYGDSNLGNHVKDIEELIEYGVDVNAADADGKTALILLASSGSYYANQGAVTRHEYNRINLIELLIKHGADPSIRDADGLTAKDYAEENAHLNEMIIKLLEKWGG